MTTVHVTAGQDLQKAIDAAQPGDVIALAAGAHFTGNFVLPAHPGESQAFITIRTDAPDLPGAATRMDPRWSGRLAVLQSPNNEAALKTAPGAHHWRIENVEFAPNRRGDGNILELGSATETSLDRVPSHLVLDRVYVHGDPSWGQKRGIALNSASTEIRNSYIAGIRAIGADSQAIAGWNGPGPFTIENNYLEAAGENVLFGGADPAIADLVPQHIVIRRNDIARPIEWRQPVMAAPAMVTARTGDGGSVAPGRYIYKVIAERPTSGGAAALSAATAAAPVTLSAPGSVRIEWAPVQDAVAYRVYRTDDGGATVTWRSEMPALVDNGADAAAGSVPKEPSVWSVKNLLELKNASDVEIDGNHFEHHWAGGQPGYAIVFTVRNQDGKAPWSRVEHVRFTNNVVQHVAAGINILGVDNNHPSGRTTDITIANNLFTDVSASAWGGNGDFLQIGDAPQAIHVEHNTVEQTGRILSVYAGKGQGPVNGFVFRSNVIRHNAYGVHGDGTGVGSDTFKRYMPDAVFEGNVVAGGDSGRYPSGNRFVSDSDFAAYASGSRRERDAGVNRAALDAARTSAPGGPAARPPDTR